MVFVQAVYYIYRAYNGQELRSKDTELGREQVSKQAILTSLSLN